MGFRVSAAVSAVSYTHLDVYKRQTYLNLLTSGKLSEHLYQTEQTALQRLELLTKQLSKEQGVTEELKEKAPMQWVGPVSYTHLGYPENRR